MTRKIVQKSLQVKMPRYVWKEEENKYIYFLQQKHSTFWTANKRKQISKHNPCKISSCENLLELRLMIHTIQWKHLQIAIELCFYCEELSWKCTY